MQYMVWFEYQVCLFELTFTGSKYLFIAIACIHFLGSKAKLNKFPLFVRVLFGGRY